MAKFVTILVAIIAVNGSSPNPHICNDHAICDKDHIGEFVCNSHHAPLTCDYEDATEVSHERWFWTSRNQIGPCDCRPEYVNGQRCESGWQESNYDQWYCAKTGIWQGP